MIEAVVMESYVHNIQLFEAFLSRKLPEKDSISCGAWKLLHSTFTDNLSGFTP